jgi:TfoX/Sxy family transcriptional regulator of competence genes
MTLRKHVLEVLHTLRPLGAIKARYCMGQTATLIYHDRVIGVISTDGLFIKSDAITEPIFDRAGAKLFHSPLRSRMAHAFPFRKVPAEAQHCSKAMLNWARLGIEAVERETLPA